MKLRVALAVAGAVAAAAGLLFVWQQTDQFLIRDPRFALATSEEEEGGPRLEGVRYASRDRIRSVFRRDEGRSVYLLPLAERRRNLLAVEWVKDAAVTRIWPNQVGVRVMERKPLAFARTGGETAMIDEDGVFLPIVEGTKFRLPVVMGLSPNQTEAQRKERLRHLVKLAADVGRHMDRVSEVDLADPENLKIVFLIDGQTRRLHLGRARFGVRLRSLIDNWSEVKQKLPEGRALDLRLEDRITTVEDPHGE
jgi:cell division protein FtsQ